MANRGSYPHPVIDEADDVTSEFEVINVLIDPTQQDIEVTYEIRTDDPDLSRLLDSGDAFHSLRWRCSSTISAGEMKPTVYQRTGTGYKLRAWLDQQEVRGDVVAEVRVLVAEELIGHSWQNQHADYGDATFHLLLGDVLADGGTFRFNAKKKYDPLDPPIGSCFKFLRSTSLRKYIKVSFDANDAVVVQIAATTFDDFKLLANRPDLQIALVVLPALLETLYFIKSNNDEEPLDDKAWFSTISDLVDEHGGWEQSPLLLAQKILEGPLDSVVRKGINFEDDE